MTGGYVGVGLETTRALAAAGATAVPADFAGPRGVKPWAMDPELAERLWAMSEGWTGVTFGDA